MEKKQKFQTVIIIESCSHLELYNLPVEILLKASRILEQNGKVQVHVKVVENNFVGNRDRAKYIWYQILVILDVVSTLKICT